MGGKFVVEYKRSQLEPDFIEESFMVPVPSFYKMKTTIFHYICYAKLGVGCVHGYWVNFLQFAGCVCLKFLQVSGAFQLPERVQIFRTPLQTGQAFSVTAVKSGAS